MKTSNNTVLIMGGSAGIGFEIAKLFSQNNNQVIITGRNEERLKQAASQLKNVTPVVCDVSNENDVDNFVNTLNKNFPALNVLINNAGKAYAYKLGAGANAFDKAAEEILTNYISITRLTEKLLPLLEKQEDAAIVNVSSIVALVPSQKTPTYSASKAALHSYTQILRHSLSQTTSVKVYELMPPLVNTDFSQEIGGINGIPPSVVAETFLSAFKNNEYEIHVGRTADMYKLSLSSPAEAFRIMNPVAIVAAQ